MELFKSRTRVTYTNAVGDKVYPVVVDIKKGIKSTEDIQFVSSDVNTGILSVAFIQGNDNYNVTGADVVCSVMRPDASTLELPCEVVGENIVEVPLGINGTSQDGVYSFDFKVFKGENKVVGTPIMNYSVSLSIGNDVVVEEDDRLPVLTVLMTQLTELKDEAREVINQANTATVASREATANAIEATNNANAVSERVSQETSEVISRVDNKVNEVETRFNALTTSQQQDAEVIDARDGETSLKARLDRDIEKAKQVYVELEGSYISTESSTGAIQDIEILGNTVQDTDNLADIKSVGVLQEDGTYKMSILSCGKNLFDGELESGTYQYNNGVKIPSTTEIRSAHKIKVNPSSNYIISSNKPTGNIGVYYYDSKENFIKSGYDGGQKIVTTEDTHFIAFRFTDLDLDRTVQLEEGTVATPYEPYQENKCDILLPCQLEKVGDVADRLYYDDVEKAWCVEKNVKTIKLNGTEQGWYLGEGGRFFEVPINDIQIPNKPIICDKYKHMVASTGVETGKITTVQHKAIRIHPSDMTGLTLEVFKKQLSQDNVLVKYPTTEPQKIILPLSTQIQLNSFFGTTHVYTESGEVEGTIKCKIPKSLGATVQSLNNKTDILSDRIEAIEGLKESQNMKYETDKGYLVCKETKNGVIDDLKLEGKTLVNLSQSTVIDLGTSDLIETRITPGKPHTIVVFGNYEGHLNFLGFADSSHLENKFLSVNGYTVILDTFSYSNSTVNKVKFRKQNIITDGEVKILILEGDHTQNPPSYFEGLMSVGQDVDKIEVLSRKEDGNLLDIKEVKGFFGSSPSYNEGVITGGYGIEIHSNNLFLTKGTYIFSFELDRNTDSVVDYYTIAFCGYNSENILGNIVINTLNNGTCTKTITIDRDINVKYIKFDCRSQRTNATVSKICLSKTSNHTYTPHQSDKKQILFYNENGELEPIQELHEWDSIEKHSDNKWYYHKRSGKVVLNGNEDWLLKQVNTNCTVFALRETQLQNKIKLSPQGVSDKFAWESVLGLSTEVECIGGHSVDVNTIRIAVAKSKLSTQDVQGFKQWLQANNVTVVYQLAEEEVYEIAPLHLDSYANETLILCNSGAISPKMEFSITSHINELIKSQGDRISLLEEKMYKALKQVLAGDMYSLAELLYPEDFVEENPENEIMLLPFE